jgi:hypothetical protein
MLHPAVSLVAILLLAGCVPTDPIITPASEPDAAPIFASDEEALAAATDAFANYLSVSDEILSDGGVGAERLLKVATPTWVTEQAAGFEKAKRESLHTTGQTIFENVALQQYDRNSIDGTAVVRLYLCVDLSGVDVLDSNGDSIVSPSRPDRTPVEVTFDSPNNDSTSPLLVSSEDVLGGRDFCD